MQETKKDCLMVAENTIASLSVLSILGDRNEQQDDYGFLLPSDECLVVVADGMGGLESGSIASETAVKEFLSDYNEKKPVENPTEFLFDATNNANGSVCALTSATGLPLGAGTTLTAVFVKNGCLNWNSVGDSRIYLWRKGEFVQLTKDQNYKAVLDSQLATGSITFSEYNEEIIRGDALISYLGVDTECLIDRNLSPLSLKSDDRIILMSDGLYKLLSDNEISAILGSSQSVKEIAVMLEKQAQSNSINKRKKRDNMTVAVLKIK